MITVETGVYRMLKPSATKLAASANTADLISAFIAKGGIVSVKPVAVAAGLRKTRYVKRIAKVEIES
jgi:hypothetical protein